MQNTIARTKKEEDIVKLTPVNPKNKLLIDEFEKFKKQI